MKALRNMDDEEFMDAWTKQGETVQAGKEKLREFSKEHDRRLSSASARAKLETMSDSEKLALAQIVESEGIETEEEVNSNG